MAKRKAPEDSPLAGSTDQEQSKTRSRKRKKKEPASAGESVHATKDNRGRIAANLQRREVQWLFQPWIPRGMLSLVAGLPAVGKSTFLAWLISQAGRACILPGYEEDPEVTTLPRFVANGVDLWQVKFLDDKRYTLPRDKKALIARLKEWGATLLVMDPIDSYLDDGLNENVGPDVREFLESCAEIATATNAAVVGVRHPGKDRTNVMPGSRQWRAVPRSIVELTTDGGTPPRYMLRHFKDSLGQDTVPTQYVLAGERGQPRRFQLGKQLDTSLADLALVAEGPTGRKKVMEACQVIRHMFETDNEPTVNDLVSQCRVLGIGEHARDDAKRLLGIVSKPSGMSGKFIMVRTQKEWPAWLPSAETGV